MHNRILITGATGFIGRQIIPLLTLAGWDVHAITRTPQQHMAGVTWHEWDLLTQTPWLYLNHIRPTHLLHLAWEARPGVFWNSPNNLLWLAASTQLAEAFIASGGQHIIAAGSCAEYDWHAAPHATPWPETTPCKPATLYGECKLELLHRLQAMAREHTTRLAWGRLFFLFGAHEPQEKLVASIITSLLAGQPAKCTSGTQIRDFVSSEYAAQCFAAMVQQPAQGVFNIGTGQGISVAALATMIGEIALATHLIQLGALPDRPNEPPFIVANTTRVQNELQIPPFDVYRSLKQTVEWWRGHTL